RNALLKLLSTHGWTATADRELGKGLKVDIWATRQANENIAVEVRYKTSLLTCEANGEIFELKNQAAQDISRYDFWNDVSKLEKVVSGRPGTHGYAILITNEHLYWEKPKKQRSVDEDFLLYE